MSKAFSLGGLKSAALSGYKTERLKTAGYAILGSFVTSYVSGKVYGLVGGVLPKDGALGKAAKVGTTLLSAGLVGYAAKRVVPSHANAVFLGGMISGAAEGLTQVKSALGMSGLGDWDVAGENGYDIAAGLGDFAMPKQLNRPVHMHGMGDFADPRQLRAPVHMHGMNDYGSAAQVSHADGLVGEEIEMSM